MFSLMDLIVLGCGFYGLYTVYLLKTTGEMKTKLLLSSEIDFKKCKDKAGYIKYVSPRLIIFSIIAIVNGALNLIHSYVVILPQPVILISYIALLVVIIWFAVISKKSVKMFW
jgi:hypothetical protein